MAIWSLTQERVEKLLKQIGDKEEEIDALIKMSKEDLWNKDLDDFLAEWKFQLDDEAKRQKKVANLGRRASSKLKIGAKAPMARKRKAQGEDPDDSDFGISKPKKPTVINRLQPKPGLLSHLTRPSATAKASVKAGPVTKPVQKNLDAVRMQLDGTEDAPVEEHIPKSTKAPAVAKRATTMTKEDNDSLDEDEDVVQPATTRQPRGAARKVIKYGGSDDSDDDNGDDLLGDVSKMVKGIGGSVAEPTTGSRPLFSTSMSRPGSSAGLPKSNPRPSKLDVGFSDDETDYSKLAPQPSIRNAAAMTAKEITLSEGEGEGDSLNEILSKPISKGAKAVAKGAPKPVVKASAAAKPKRAPAAKKAAPASAPAPAPPPPKKAPLSPAAKAYAAKQARNGKKRVVESDSDDDGGVDVVADDILDSPPAKAQDEGIAEPSPPPAATARPSRRAATTAKKATYVIDDDDSEEVSSAGEDFSEGFSGSE